jgi:hypothetical protein
VFSRSGLPNCKMVIGWELRLSIVVVAYFLKRESPQLLCSGFCKTSQLRETRSCESSQVAPGIWNPDMERTTGRPSIRCCNAFIVLRLLFLAIVFCSCPHYDQWSLRHVIQYLNNTLFSSCASNSWDHWSSFEAIKYRFPTAWALVFILPTASKGLVLDTRTLSLKLSAFM